MASNPNHISGEELGSMLAALAIYRIGLVDLRFREDEEESRVIRDKTLIFVSEVLGPKIVHKVDQIEAQLRETVKRNRNGN